MNTTQQLTQKGLVKPPKWLPNNVHYETIMGSVAYGVSSDTSDMDVYGFCIPEKDMVFPHLRGEISGFGRQIQRVEVDAATRALEEIQMILDRTRRTV